MEFKKVVVKYVKKNLNNGAAEKFKENRKIVCK